MISINVETHLEYLPQHLEPRICGNKYIIRSITTHTKRFQWGFTSPHPRPLHGKKKLSEVDIDLIFEVTKSNPHSIYAMEAFVCD